jgi:hypothetical protein
MKYTYHKGIIRPFVEGGMMFHYFYYTKTVLLQRPSFDGTYPQLIEEEGGAAGFHVAAGSNFKVGKDSFIFLSFAYYFELVALSPITYVLSLGYTL